METRRFYQDTAEKGGFAFTGLLIGAAAGGLAALLLAPQSGRKTRHLISEKASDLKDMAADTADTARSQFSQVAEKAQQMRGQQSDITDKLSSKAKDVAQRARKEAKDVADRARHEAKQAMKSSKQQDYDFMDEDEGDFNFGSMLMGMLVGAALGAGTALLTAPQAGERTRHMIEDKATQLKDQAKDATENVRHQAKNAIDTAKDKAQSTIQSAKESTSSNPNPTNRELREEVEIMENVRNREFPL